MTRGKRDPLTPTRYKPLEGAKRPLPIIERAIPEADEYLTPHQQHLRGAAVTHTNQRLGVEGVPSEHP